MISSPPHLCLSHWEMPCHAASHARPQSQYSAELSLQLPGWGGGMARRQGGPDPKEAALAEARCLNPHPEQVTDEAFLSGEFFDARDAVQVKYEMVRRVSIDGAPVTATAAAFGYSRPSYYQAAAALAESGLDGLVPARPGPRGGHKLTGQILTGAEAQLAADPALKPAALAGPIEGEFGVRVHPRSVERALARRRE